MPQSPNPRPEAPGLHQARLMAAASARKPTDGDRPPPSVFPGPRQKVLPGQLSLTDTVEEVPVERAADDQPAA
jgi:hypothetical protein